LPAIIPELNLPFLIPKRQIDDDVER